MDKGGGGASAIFVPLVASLKTGMQDGLVELRHIDVARDARSEKNLCDFWFLMSNLYRRIAEPTI